MHDVHTRTVVDLSYGSDNIYFDQLLLEHDLMWTTVHFILHTYTKHVFCSNRNEGWFHMLFMNTYGSFKLHVQRVQVQCPEIYRFRDTMPEDHVLLYMDFAENNNCCHLDEVQAPYWNATFVSLHTMVVYYPVGSEKKLYKVKSLCLMSCHITQFQSTPT